MKCAGSVVLSVLALDWRRAGKLLPLQQRFVFDQINSEDRGFNGQSRKPMVKIEGFRTGGNSMNEHKPRRNFICCAHGSSHNVRQESAPPTFSLPIRGNGQAPQNNRWNVFGQIAPHRSGHIVVQNLAHAEAKITDDFA